MDTHTNFSTHLTPELSFHPSNLDRFAQDATMRSSDDATSAAISLAARQVADISKSKAIIAFTTSKPTVSYYLSALIHKPSLSHPPSLTYPLSPTLTHLPSLTYPLSPTLSHLPSLTYPHSPTLSHLPSLTHPLIQRYFIDVMPNYQQHPKTPH